MVLNRTATKTIDASVFVDTSGLICSDKQCAISTVWCLDRDLGSVIEQLEQDRELVQYQGPMHFVDIRNGSNGPKRLGISWLQRLARVTTFPVSARVDVLKSYGFDLSYYGGLDQSPRTTATNRWVCKSIEDQLRENRFVSADKVRLSVYVDGPADSLDPRTGLLNYLASELPFKTIDECVPSVDVVRTEGVAKVGQSERSQRGVSDLVSLADFVAGVVARAFLPRSDAGKVKQYLSIEAIKLYAEILRKQISDRFIINQIRGGKYQAVPAGSFPIQK